MNKDPRPQDNLTMLGFKHKATPVLSLLSISDGKDYIYMDQAWVHKAASYGVEEMDVDLFQRHYDFEPGDNPEWVSTNMILDKDNYWGMGPAAIFYFVIPTEVRRFEQFCNGYAVVMPGGDIMLPHIVSIEAFARNTPPGDTHRKRLADDLVANGQDRFRFIAAAVLKKDSPEWVEYTTVNARALARRNSLPRRDNT
jgi:hypothetical protein